MAKQERLEAQCPPDAHKVMRQPENEVKASLVVKIEDRELETFGGRDLAEVLSLFSPKPQLLASEKVQKAVLENAAEAEISPAFLNLKVEGAGFLSYPDGSVSSVKKVCDLSADLELYEDFLAHLPEDCYLVVDSLSMLIMRSISTVYPWDALLAADFIRQFKGAQSILSAADKETLYRVRYGREDASELKDSNAFQFLKLERKLFLQYPSEDQ